MLEQSVKNLILVGCLLISIGVLWDISDYRNNLETQKNGIEMQTLKEQGVTLNEEQEDVLKKWEKFV